MSKLNPKSFLKNKNIIDDKNSSLINLLNSISSCQLSDAFNAVCGRNGVIPNLKSINNKKVYGRITTCETDSDDWGTITLAMDEASVGDILFIKASDKNASIWGELASTSAKKQGVAGVAVYGSVRDLDALLYIDFPVFACDFKPNAGKALGLGNINSDLFIDGFKISPGDFFLGDETGVVVINQNLFNDVILKALEIKKMESNIIKQLNDGKSLSEIVNLK